MTLPADCTKKKFFLQEKLKAQGKMDKTKANEIFR